MVKAVGLAWLFWVLAACTPQPDARPRAVPQTTDRPRTTAESTSPQTTRGPADLPRAVVPSSVDGALCYWAFRGGMYTESN
jgi:hypothetical protein